MDILRDFDIIEIPLEGVAAYWLSIKKLVDEKRSFKPLGEEAEYTSEPYIKYLLDVVFSKLSPARVQELATLKRMAMLEEFARKVNLMRISLMDIATGENPRKSLAKMTAQYAKAPLGEEKAFELVQELVKQAQKNPSETPAFFSIDHRQKPEQLMVSLLFYVFWSRRKGKFACQPLLELVSSAFFQDGLSLVIDGFDAPFVRKRLKIHKQALLQESRVKMELSEKMSLAIREKYSYDDVFRIAKACLV